MISNNARCTWEIKYNIAMENVSFQNKKYFQLLMELNYLEEKVNLLNLHQLIFMMLNIAHFR